MKPMDFLKEVELNYKVEDIATNELRVWQILRWHYANSYENMVINGGGSSTNSNVVDSKYTRALSKVSNSIWNIHKYFSNYPYIIFTDRLEERTIDSKVSDKIAHGFIKEFGSESLICLNCIDSKHKNNSEYYHKNYISTSLFDIKKVTKKVDVKIDQCSILDEIERSYGVRVDYISIINNFFKYVEVFDDFLKTKQCKAVFVNCYYNLMHQALIFSAHKNNIKVVEFQHGIINSNHYAYNIFKPIGKDVFSDYIFVFGDYVKDIISNNYIESNNIYSIGNYYIEDVIRDSKENDKVIRYFSKIRNEYRKIVVVTSQITIEEKLIDFIKTAAASDNEILYMFIPRYFNKDFSKYNFPQNVIIEENIDFYHSVGYCDLHLTVYSTCAIEALSFGTPNILINIDNLSEDNLRDLLTESEYTRYVNEPYELVKAINDTAIVNKDDVIKVSQRFYKQENIKNIKNAMKAIDLI
ncbi:hypothetical protein CFB3_36800 [Clostridium folliculivorans]|uniref:Uncharacterized protein n=2 Tax=Clostridium folliculivorans TaxID=2886038 RepID=A0A9W5Y5Q4_9CLOT|nr:hypothetical protein CFOLD11_37490 [Clostridium folliculivorans]GKU31573.1 hypothetical protein CFB3_36800 [Clostridium folliculivorans]